MRRYLKVFGLGLLALLIIIVVGFMIWAGNPADPEQAALNSLSTTITVDYQETGNWLVFSPKGEHPTTGLIFYPGARVDYRAYAPLAHDISEAGYLVVVVRMPLNFAFFGINQASDVIAAYPEISHWAIGGHSLGGAMAAQYASANSGQIMGLVLWASYPAESNDLSGSGINVVSIYATNDGLATPLDIEDSKPNLPGDTSYIEIKGGNHAGFGWYGSQNGDGIALINKTEQQTQIVQATVSLLGSLSE